MPPTRPLRLEPEWDTRFSRMVGVSAVGHVLAIVALMVIAWQSGRSPEPLVAYTVELTDPSALGGRLPPGPPAAAVSAGPPAAAAPEPKGDSPEPAAPPEKPAAPPEPAAEAKPPEPPPVAKPPEPEVKLPEPVAKPPPPKPEAKPEPPKPVAAKPEPVKPVPAKPEAPPKPVQAAKAEPPKAAPAPAKPVTEATPKPPAPAAAAEPHKAGSPTGTAEAPHDAYSAAAERWRARASGLGGTDTGTGPVGTGGGPGGGGQLVGLEFLAYRQTVINTIRAQWTNVIATPGLMASVRFVIAPDGAVSDARLEQSSGNAAYDASVLRAVQRTPTLPPPPARYAKDFREFVMEFHSEDQGGQGTG
jgi:colicin import membrane protein